MFGDDFLRGREAGPAAGADRHMPPDLAQRLGAEFQRFANLAIGDALADANVHASFWLGEILGARLRISSRLILNANKNDCQ